MSELKMMITRRAFLTLAAASVLVPTAVAAAVRQPGSTFKVATEDGMLAEYLVFDRQLTTEEASAVHRYLIDRYADD